MQVARLLAHLLRWPCWPGRLCAAAGQAHAGGGGAGLRGADGPGAAGQGPSVPLAGAGTGGDEPGRAAGHLCRQAAAGDGGGRSRHRPPDGSASQRRLLSLPDRARHGEAVFVDVTTCRAAPRSWPSAATAGRALRASPASATVARCGTGSGRGRGQGSRARAIRPATAKRAEIEEPVATSIGAWRVYRDAECDRQRDADPAALDRPLPGVPRRPDPRAGAPARP